MRVLTALLASLCCLLAACPPVGAYYIRSMDVSISIEPDSTLSIQERILVDFQYEQRHGIYRDIRVAENDRLGSSRKLRVNVTGVTDGQTGARPYKAFRVGPYYRVKIGDADTTVTGQQTYTIHYTVQNGLLYFPDHDELYWDVTGDEWAVPITASSCVVKLPSGAPPAGSRANAWVGPAGAVEKASVSASPESFQFRSPRQLEQAEGLTVAVAWPKGHVTPPSLLRKTFWFLSDNFFALLPILYGLGFFFLWRAIGKDPDPGISEAVLYEPPDALRPAELGTLMDERVDTSDITSTIIDLAVRGYLTISEQPGSWFTGPDYTITKKTPEKPDPAGGLSDFEEKIYSSLFESGDVADVSSLRNRFYTSIPGIKTCLYDSMLKRRYFSESPERVRTLCATIGGGMVLIGAVLAFVMYGQLNSGSASIAPGWGIALALCGAITLFYSPAMPRKTYQGKRALVGARGFSEYLRRAELPDVELQEKRGLFEKYLPYAMALGVADQWTRAFEGIYIEPPSWYYGSWNNGFRPSYLGKSLNSATSQMGAAMVSQPRSASGGGSGFGGGGGFSGGGFGGGGGGAW